VKITLTTDHRTCSRCECELSDDGGADDTGGGGVADVVAAGINGGGTLMSDITITLVALGMVLLKK
jgi:hypothetical protein